MSTKILIVEGDATLADTLRMILRDEGFDPRIEATGEDALIAFDEFQPDLVLLESTLPDMNGVAVCRSIRSSSGVPIIMLSTDNDLANVVAAFQAGADDYLQKPCRSPELVARIQAKLRRANGNSQDKYEIGDLIICVPEHSVKRDGENIRLTPLEFSLLLALAKRPQQVLSRSQLLDEVWGYSHSTDTRLVNVHVQRLRSKIERDPEKPEIVVTVRGVGYRAGAAR